MKYARITVISLALVSLLVAGTAFANQNGENKEVKEVKEQRKETKAAFDPACIQAAVDKRDTSLVTATTSFGTGLTTALTARKDAIKTAYAKTDRKERRSALKSAWDAYKKTRREVVSTMRTAQKSAWATYRKEASACKVNSLIEEGVSKSVDTIYVE